MLTRLLVAQTAMLRGQDHRKGKLRRKHLVRQRYTPSPGCPPACDSFVLRIPPGKSRAHHSESMLASRSDAVPDLLDPAYVLYHYLRRSGLDSASANAYLFPAVPFVSIASRTAAGDDDFLDNIGGQNIKNISNQSKSMALS